VWDIENGHCLHTLLGHVAAVRCVQYDGRRIVSGAYDYTVRVWDPDTGTCLHTLQGHSNRVYCLQVTHWPPATPPPKKLTPKKFILKNNGAMNIVHVHKGKIE
jgi:WD40 repeat protein